MSVSGFKFFGYVDIVFQVIFGLCWIEQIVSVIDCIFVDFVVVYDCIYSDMYVFDLVQVVENVEYVNVSVCGLFYKGLNYVVRIVGIFNIV